MDTIKEWNLFICNNMDGTRNHYVKWNKSGTERQVPYDFIHMWNLKKWTVEWWFPESGGSRRDGGMGIVHQRVLSYTWVGVWNSRMQLHSRMTTNRKLKRLHERLLELINKFSKVEGYQINIQRSVVMLYTSNELFDMKIKKTIHLQ
jgi:hypothetical protein